MSTRIIKTSKEAKREEDSRLVKGKCPECGYKYNIGCSHHETKGLFKIQSRECVHVSCSNCGCVYEYDSDLKSN